MDKETKALRIKKAGDCVHKTFVKAHNLIHKEISQFVKNAGESEYGEQEVYLMYMRSVNRLYQNAFNMAMAVSLPQIEKLDKEIDEKEKTNSSK